MSSAFEIPVALVKGNPLLKSFLALSPPELKPNLLSGNLSQQQLAVDAIFNQLPRFYLAIFQMSGKLADRIRRRLNPKYLSHIQTQRYDVQSELVEGRSNQYTTTTRLTAGEATLVFEMGNGHMRTVADMDALILGALATGKIESVDAPAITVTHKVHGRCLLLRVDLIGGHEVLTVCSRNGPAISLFCRKRQDAGGGAEAVRVESSNSGRSYSLDAIDDRTTVARPEDWVMIDPSEFQTVRRLAPRLFGAARRQGLESVTFLAEGSGQNMTTWFDARTKRGIDEDTGAPSIFFFTARGPAGQVYDHHQLVEWGLPTTTLIRSPSDRSQWTLREIIDIHDQRGRVAVKGKTFPVPGIVEYAGHQLCGDVDSFDAHPIEGVAINFGALTIKAKNPRFADDEEKAEVKERG